MDAPTTYSWIFISVEAAGRGSPASLDEIIGAADWLNHDIPLHADLQTAIGWLMQEGLVVRNGRDYELTQKGRDLAAEIYSRAPQPFDAWDLLKQRLACADVPTELADISETEWQQAFEEYQKRMAEILRKTR